MSNPVVRTVFEAWSDYRRKMLPADIRPTQLLECRRAFYVGAQALLIAALNSPDAETFNSLGQELRRVLADIVDGPRKYQAKQKLLDEIVTSRDSIEAEKGVLQESAWHAYLSTACYHEKHEECRKVCKFCPAACSCPCHESGTRNATE